MGRSTYAVVAALASVVALAILSPLATDTLPGHGAVTGHPQGSAGDHGKLNGGFAGAYGLIEYGQIGYPHSDPAYRDMMIVVAKYDENGGDISGENKEIVAGMLEGIGARDIEAAETLSFVTASVPAERIPDVSGHDLVYSVDYDWALSHPTIGKMRVTVGATADDLRRPIGTVANGSGVTVGIVDEGVNHPLGVNDKVIGRISCDDLSCSYVPVEDVVGPDPGNQGVSHGTLVALVIAGSGFPEHNGIAPGVSIMDAGLSLFYLGAGDASISHAFSWLLREDADVANLSFGFGKCRESDIGATRQLITGGAVDNGMVVVVSSGNQGDIGSGQNQVPVYQSVNQWGCAHNVITVGGINDRDLDNIQMYSGSGRGPATHRVDGVTHPILKPEIVAPAVLQVPQYTANGATTLISGTSFSTPAVSAVAALVLQERDMEPAAVKTAILLGANWTGPVPCTSVQYEQYNATDNCSHGRQPGSFTEGGDSLEVVNNVGFGILDAAKTLDYVSQASGRHLVEGSLESDANVDGYTFEVTDTENPVKIILSWTVDMFYDGYYDPRGKNYFADLGFTVNCPGMDTISAQSAYQANEFAVFTPPEAGTCTVAVTGSGIDTPRRSQQDYAIASTLPLDAVDIDRPVPAISTAEPSPTNAHTITFTADFGEQVDATTFTASDVSASDGTVSGPLPANITAGTFTFEVSGMATGNLTVSIPEGGVLDMAGNNNTASDPYVVEIERTRPTPTLSTEASSPVNTPDITFTADFGEQVDATTFTASDVSASDGTVSGPLPANITAGTFTFKVSGMATGNLTVSIPEGGVLDMAGNNNTASDPYVVEIERTRPAPTLSTEAFSPVNASRITFTADFGGQVDATTFTASDVSASGGTVSGPLPANITAGTFTFEVSGLVAGNLTVSIPEGGVLDPIGNSNTASDTLALTVTSIPAGTTPGAAFVTTWQTTSANEFILIPVGGSTGTYTVIWGDASIDADVSGHQMHTYKAAGTYTVSIYGDFSQIYLPYHYESSLKLQSIEQWGDIRWESMRGAFNGASNMVYRATDAPDLSAVTDTSEMFMFALRFNGNLSNWNVSSVTDMSSMFAIARAFNGDISSWNVSGITDMSNMLDGANSFARNLGDWYIVLDDTVMSGPDETLAISAQNAYLDGQNPTYAVDGTAPNGDKFWIVNASHLAVRADQTVVPGQYNVTIKSTGSFGEGNSKTVEITVGNDTIHHTNSPPAVGAGDDQEVVEGAAVSLSGTVTDDDPGDTLTYSWTHDGALAITITGSDSLSASFTAPDVAANTTITVTLTVDDGTVEVSDTLQVTVTDSPNSPPTVNAGQDQEVAEGATVTLSGTVSDDDPEDTLAYSWTHDDTLSITITGSDSLSASFTAPDVAANTTITVTLTVDDGTVEVSDTLQVTIADSPNSPPTVNAGQDQEVAEGATVTLSGTVSDDDPEDTLAYSWTHDDTLSITITGSDSLSASFTAPDVAANTTITVTLTVDDGTVEVSDTLQVTVTDSPNSPPTVNAGQDQEVAEGATVTLSGTVSDDDPEDTLAYSWTHDDTLSITITGSDSLSASFTAPDVAANTTITVTLTVDDGTVEVSDTLQVTIADSPNSPPTVNAGPDQTAAEGSAVSLNGAVADSDTEDTLTYSWSHNSTLPITLDASALDASFTAPQVDSDTAIAFTLTADDGVVVHSDTVTVTVLDVPASYTQTQPVVLEPNEPRDARDMGRIILSSTQPGTIDVGWEAPNEAPVDYRISWAKVGEPFPLWTDLSGNAFPTDTSHTITGLEEGETYKVKVRARYDGTAGDWSGEVMIAVAGAAATTATPDNPTITDSANSPPTASAGPDQTAAEGSAVSLDGAATDSDTEDTLAYSWTHDDTLSITITGSDSLSASFTAPDVAANTTITVTLTVDDGTVEVSDTLQVTVTDSPNSPPTVNAGQDQEVAEGATVTLSGTVSDDDPEDTLAYSWTHDDTLSITITGSDSLSASFTAPDVAANTTITVTLTVDDGTVEVSDTLQVTVTDSPNSPPTVNAGQDQEVAEGATVTLSGTVSDDDPEDTLAYSWTHDDTLSITITGSDSLSASFTAPDVAANTTITVTLTVDDGTVEVSDTLQVTIADSPNSPPTVNAGPDQTAAEGSAVSLNGAVADSDTEDTLTYSWSHNSTLPITLDASALDASFTAPQVDSDTAIAFTLTADDGVVVHSDTVTVTVLDVPASYTQTQPVVLEPNEPRDARDMGRIILSSTQPGTIDVGWEAPNEAPVDYRISWAKVGEPFPLWTDLSGNAFPTDTSHTITGLEEGETYKVKVRARYDGTAGDWSGEVMIAVAGAAATTATPDNPTITDSANSPPTASAGPDQTAAEGSAVSLDGAATDSDTEDTLAYSWTHDDTLSITITGSDSLSASFTAPDVAANTTITVTLTVDDGTVEVSDTLQVTVTDSPNSPPTVNAGQDQEVAEGATVTLSGTVSDDDPEDTLAYSWTHDDTLSITITGSDSLSASFTAPDVAANTTITVTLTVDDGTVEVSDTLQVTVTDSPNSPPTVNAGPDQTAAEGSAVSLDGAATDSDTEDTLTYSWSHNSTLSITLDASALDASFTAPQVDSDTAIAFTLTADDGVVVHSDTVTVTVLDVPASYTQTQPVVLEPNEPRDARDMGRIILSSTQPGTIDVGWEAPNEAPVDYRISWAKVGEPFPLWTDLSGNAFPTDTSHTITGLEEGETYKVKVRARYDGTAGDWSGEATIAVAETR